MKGFKTNTMVLMLVFFNISINAAGAISVNFLSPKDISTSLEQSFCYNFVPPEEGCNTEYSTLFNLDARELIGRAGIRCNPQDFDFTVQTIYWPTLFDCLNAGISTKYHFYSCYEESMEHDFNAGLAVKVKVKSFMDIYLEAGHHWKLSVIPTYYEKIKIWDSSMNIGLGFNFYPSEKIMLNLGAFTSSFYDYPLFLSWFFNAGIKYNLSDRIYLQAELESEWLDFYTICPYANKAGINVTWGYRL